MMMMFNSIRLFYVIVLVISFECYSFQNSVIETEKHYEGYKLLRVTPKSDDQLKFLNKISNDINFMVPTKLIDFWKEPSDVGSSVDLMVAPIISKKIETELFKQNLIPKIIIPNIGEVVEEEKRSISENSLLYRPKSWVQNNSYLFFHNYHPLNEMYEFLDDLVSYNPQLSSVETIGASTEQRPLKMIKIGKKKIDYYNYTIEKPIIWIDAGLHAREWIAPMTALYIANKLVQQSDDAIKLLDQFDFYIMPSANPDGFEYSRTHDRMWRKTRSFNPSFLGLFCRGVDPNRNWGFKWGVAGSSTNPCSEVYQGPRAFSEPETKAMSNYVLKIKDRVKLFISLHSYSQLILTPWGYTSELPSQYPDMIKRANEGAEAIKSATGQLYKVGSSTKVLYSASGGADDWAHGIAGIKYSYTIELRDTGNYGFVLPKEHIIPTGMELYEALKVMSQSINDELIDCSCKNITTTKA